MKHLAGFVFGILLGVALASGVRDLTATSEYETAGSLSANGTVGCARADLNGDGSQDVRDAIHLLTYLFGSGPAPVECGPPPTAPTRVRFLNDLFCKDSSFEAKVVLCGAEATDSAGDGGATSACVDVLDSGECLVEVSAMEANCDAIEICDTIPVREGFMYDVVLTVGDGPVVWWYERELTVSADCPAPPPFGSFPDGIASTCSGTDKQAGSLSLTTEH